MDEETKSMKSMEMISENTKIQERITEACFRISSFILTKAWLKRRNDCNKLASCVEEAFEKCQIAEANLDSKKSLYYEKQKENEDLTCQLRLTQKEVETLNHSFDELTLKVNNLESKKEELLLQFNTRCEECIDTNMQISDLKLKLLDILEKNQKLEIEVETEKSTAEKFNEQGDKLNDELNELKAKCAESENKLLRSIEGIDDEIKRTKFEKKQLQYKLMELKRYIEEYENTKLNKSSASMEIEKSLLYQQAAVLRDTLEQSFEHKLRKYSYTVISIILEGLKVILPAYPTDKILNA